MKEYKHTIELLKNNRYFANLMNGLFMPHGLDNGGGKGDNGSEKTFIPVNPEWIDESMSNRLTEVYHNLIPREMPFSTLVQVVRNPEQPEDTVVVDDTAKCPRYIIVTIVPESEIPYDVNFPLIQAMGVASLYSWELSRLTIAASERDARVLIATNSIPPFLNVARIEWVSLYTGQRAFAGPSNVNSIVENGEGLELDTHLFRIREMEHPVVRRLIEAVELDEK